jgi:hypothetical protein
MQERAWRRVRWLTLTVALVTAPTLARADDVADAPQAASTQQAAPDNAAVPLDLDPLRFAHAASARPERPRSVIGAARFDIKRTDHPDGSSTVAVRQPLSPDWDVKVGADLNLAPPPSTTFAPGQPLPGLEDDQSSGAAWASVGIVPNLATLDVHVDPGNAQGRIGTTLQHSVPLGSDVSVTLRDSYAVSESYGMTDNTPAGVPLAPAPPADPVTPEPAWSNARSVHVKLQPTGTTLSAAMTTSSTDPIAHNVLSVDQQVYGLLHVTTSVTDVGEPSSNKSISAKLKVDW